MTTLDFQFPYTSQRMPILARNAVATSQPLAAQAGLRMLLKGGNAVDAILATAISLTVLEPTSNGIGSDAFCILWDGKKLHGLNASGRSPAGWTPDRFKGAQAMPQRLSVQCLHSFISTQSGLSSFILDETQNEKGMRHKISRSSSKSDHQIFELAIF